MIAVLMIRDGDLDVRCPKCLAAAGANCVSTSSRASLGNSVHRERRLAAKEAKRWRLSSGR